MIVKARIYLSLFALLLPAALSAPPCMAEEAPEQIIAGIPVVEDGGLMIVAGQKIRLWGIDALDTDQHCWQGGTAWDCGRQATDALRHLVEGRMIDCHFRAKAEDDIPLAQCFKQKHHHKGDIARHLVRHGWAMNGAENAYPNAETKAKEENLGIWSSRFQTAEDWREGVQRFVGDKTDSEEK